MGKDIMYPMTDGQFQLVYNVLSFSLASMMATTLFLWLKVYAVAPKFQTPVIISGLVTFIAAYHYMRIFNSWVGAYEYKLNSADPALGRALQRCLPLHGLVAHRPDVAHGDRA